MNNIDWRSKLDEFGIEVLNRFDYWSRLGIENPITRELKSNPNFVSEIADIDGYSMIAMSRLATICQMIYYDHNNGPEKDGKAKALRRHWYAWYKVDFAQPYSRQLEKYEKANALSKHGVTKPDFRIDSLNKMLGNITQKHDTNNPSWGLNWAGRLSTTYAWFVDEKNVTYKDLWVDDASRMIQKNYERLFKNLHVILAVEKDSLHADFIEPAQRLGFRSVVSGKGKMGKAATEKVLREHFGWRPEYEKEFWEDEFNPIFTAENPLYVIHISDFDFDGEAVIGPTFAEQIRRYTPHIKEARIGIDPLTAKKILENRPKDDPVRCWEDAWYSVKVSNSGYRLWVDNKALFETNCDDCYHPYTIIGIDDEQLQRCPKCDGEHIEIHQGKTPHGFEAEALTTYEYYNLIVDAFLKILDFDELIIRLRDECKPNAYTAAEEIQSDICNDNEDYQKIQEEIDRLQNIIDEFRGEIESEIVEAGNDFYAENADDFWELEEDPEPQDMKEHVRSGWSVWKPFSTTVRTNKLVESLKDKKSDFIDELKNRTIEW